MIPKENAPSPFAADHGAVPKSVSPKWRVKCTKHLTSRPTVSMRQALSVLRVRYKDGQATAWQDVQCPQCKGQAKALLHGKTGHRGGFRCLCCGLRGDGAKLLSEFTGMSPGAVLAHWGSS